MIITNLQNIITELGLSPISNYLITELGLQKSEKRNYPIAYAGWGSGFKVIR